MDHLELYNYVYISVQRYVKKSVSEVCIVILLLRSPERGACSLEVWSSLQDRGGGGGEGPRCSVYTRIQTIITFRYLP